MVEQPSRQTLDLVPGRVFTFILAIAKYPAIAAALATKGYMPAEHDFVWKRLAKLGTLPAHGANAGTPDKAVRDAILELDAWDGPNYEIIQGILQRFYPSFIPVLFQDLEAKEGVEAVYGVATLLDRLDALETSTNPDAPNVLSLLADRSYTKAERQRLRALVDTTKKFKAQAPVSDTEREEILKELYGWITDWSGTAKAVIKRRQHLIALGVAAPRKSEKEKAKAEQAKAEQAKAEKAKQAKAEQAKVDPAKVEPAPAAAANGAGGTKP